MKRQVLQSVIDAIDRGEKCAMVTLSESDGSTPAKEGLIMSVFADGSQVGTIGGGTLEFTATQEALNAIESEKNALFKYDLSTQGELKMACGGEVAGYIQVYVPNKKLVIFGAGHVGQKIAISARTLPFDVYIVDDREAFKSEEAFKDIAQYIACIPKDIKNYLHFDRNTYIVSATRGHAWDYAVLKEILGQDVAYVGMMGSKTKVRETKKQLKDAGVSQELISRVYAPIGLDICDGTPEEIAFSVLGEILMVKNKGTNKNLRTLVE